MITSTRPTDVSPRNRCRWLGPLAFLLLVGALAVGWYQLAQLRRAIMTLESAEAERALESAAKESELVNLRRELLQLRDQLARQHASVAARPGQPALPPTATPSPGTPATVAPEPARQTATAATPPIGSPIDRVRWSALPGSQIVIDGTSSIHDWTVKGAIIGGFLEVEPAFLTESPVPRAWTNEVPAAVQVRIPVRSLKSQVLVGASKMDEVMQEAMRMKENPDIFYALEKMTIKDRPPGTNGPVSFRTRGQLVVSGVTNTIDMEVRLDRLDARRVRFSGSSALKMTDYKIPPPRPNLVGGLITTGDEVQVRFDWLVGLKQESSR